MPRVVHFEITADDTGRAKSFYEGVFGWTSQTWDGPQPYIMMNTGPKEAPGINGGLMKRQPGFPPFVNVIDVPDCDEYTAKIQAAGGKVVKPKSGVPHVGWVAYCSDTEGNVFGIIQFDEGAK